jgi:hypothetical protein
MQLSQHTSKPEIISLALFLLPSRLYCRYRNLTGSVPLVLAGVADFNRRSGIERLKRAHPAPKKFSHALRTHLIYRQKYCFLINNRKRIKKKPGTY